MRITGTDLGAPAQFQHCVFLLQGNEPTLIHEALDRLLAGLLPDGRDFNLTFVEATASSGSALVGMAQTTPFLAARRVVVVRGVERLTKIEQAPLVTAISADKLPATGALVLLKTPTVPGAGKGPDLSALTKAIERSGLIIQCDLSGKPKDIDAELSQRAQVEASRLGKRLMPATANRLVQRCEPNWGVVQGEVRKLALYVGDAPSVSEADVAAVVPELREEAVFKLVDALASRNLAESLERSAQLLKQGEAVEMILWNLSRHFRLLLQARWLFEQRQLTERELVGADDAGLRAQLPEEQNLVDELRRVPWKAQQFARQARGLDTPKLRRAFARLLETDLHLKGGEGGAVDRRLELELLCVDLCRS